MTERDKELLLVGRKVYRRYWREGAERATERREEEKEQEETRVGSLWKDSKR
jgi:hypothetical protein